MKTMLLRFAVLFLCLNFVRTSGVADLTKDFAGDVDGRYSLWPSIHHGMRMMRIRKREVEAQQTSKPDVQAGQPVVQANTEVGVQGPSEGQSIAQNTAQNAITSAQPSQTTPHSSDNPPKLSVSTKPQESLINVNKNDKEGEQPQILNNKTVEKPDRVNATNVNSTSTVYDKTKLHNTTAAEPSKINLSDPGVAKRAAIVFGGFALLATAYYFIIYRKKAVTNDAKNTHSSIDPNQFRYGVLQSEDNRSNMELSRVPLTMESDEDDDEDLEIFDLGQKKKSLSYINLQQHDEDIVLSDSRNIDMENLLVDIEDTNSETLINWSGNGSKSVL